MVEGILLTIVTAATPLLIAALGELVTERSGVLNLGVEGMMAVGAVCGFAVSYETGSPVLGVLAAIVGGAVTSMLFSVVTLVFVSNQVASGLALTLFGLGLSGMLGSAYVGTPGNKLETLNKLFANVAGIGRYFDPAGTDISKIPVLGFFLQLDPITYAGVALAVAVWWFLFRSRAGLILRAVGDSHTSAHALGYPVILVRFYAVLFGGGCAGLAGGYLSLVYTPQWAQAMTAGRGWIALALVVFATWLPGRVVLGALLFGAVSILQLHAQASGGLPLPGGGRLSVPSQFLSMLPYLTTVVVLVIIKSERS